MEIAARLARPLFVLGALAGCTAGTGHPDTGSQETGSDDTAAAEDQDRARLQGTIRVAGSSEPYEGARVQVCLQTCIVDYTDSEGAYEIPGLDTATHAFELWPTADQPLLVPMVPLTLAAGTTTVDARWFPPDQTTPIPETEQEVEILPGFFLTIGLDSIEEPFGTTVTEVYAVDLPQSEDFLPVEGGVPWRMVHLGPFDTQPSSGEGFALRLSESQDPGTAPASLELWVSLLDAEAAGVRWEKLGSFQRDPETGVLEGSALLPHLGTLVLVET